MVVYWFSHSDYKQFYGISLPIAAIPVFHHSVVPPSLVTSGYGCSLILLMGSPPASLQLTGQTELTETR